jgi:hypothetical protein
VRLRVQRHGTRQYLEGKVATIWPPPEPLTRIESTVLERYKEETRRAGDQMAMNYPTLRGFKPSLMLSSQWLAAFYRFVDPERRIGEDLNYRDRIRSATGIVLPGGSIIFDGRRNRDVPLVGHEQYRVLMRVAIGGR